MGKPCLSLGKSCCHGVGKPLPPVSAVERDGLGQVRLTVKPVLLMARVHTSRSNLLLMSGCISVMVRILACQSCPPGPRLPSHPVQPSSPWS